jgi:hypothetical protein
MIITERIPFPRRLTKNKIKQIIVYLKYVGEHMICETQTGWAIAAFVVL